MDKEPVRLCKISTLLITNHMLAYIYMVQHSTPMKTADAPMASDSWSCFLDVMCVTVYFFTEKVVRPVSDFLAFAHLLYLERLPKYCSI